MKRTPWTRLTAVLAALAMALSMLPVSVWAEPVNGRTTAPGVFIRKQASTDADYWFRVDQGTVLPVTDTVKKGGVTWYKVTATANGRTYIGYVHGDYMTLDGSAPAASTAETTTTTATSSGLATGSGNGTGMVTNSGVNFRELNGKENILSHKSMMKLDRGTVVELISVPPVIDSDHWYRVRYAGKEGYIQAPFIKVVSSGTGSAGTPATTTTTTVTTGSETVYGYIRTTVSGVNLRVKPAENVIQQVAKDQVLPVMGATVTTKGYEWYYVKVGSVYGYIRDDCCTECDASGKAVSTGTLPAVETAATDSSAAYGYIRLTQDKVNLRREPAGDSMEQLAKGTVLPMTGKAVSSGKYVWYPVRAASGRNGYIRNDCAEVTATGTANSETITSPETTVISAPSTAYGYIRTTVSAVNLRKVPAGAKVGSVPKNEVLAVNGPTRNDSGYIWYPVTYKGTDGYIRSDCAVVTDASGAATNTEIASASTSYVKTVLDKVNLRTGATKDAKVSYVVALGTVMPTDKKSTVGGSVWYHVSYNGTSLWVLGSCVGAATAGEYQAWANANGANAASASTSTGAYTPATAGQEATYTILKVGSSGSKVTKLVQELINQGFYKGTVTSSYTSEVEGAVKAFQTARGLTVDGIAGPLTQHALFQTVPVGAADTGNLKMAIYPAEKIDWYKGGINSLWERGASYKVYDVKTGIVWWARRWAGGHHVDAEPLTAADTARLCTIYGVSKADQIKTKNLWQRRPSLVTIGNRTFACSLYGIPHNYPEGDTIADNNFKGQLCIHFTNSKTHSGNKVDSYHKEAIEYAWLNAPNGHK